MIRKCFISVKGKWVKFLCESNATQIPEPPPRVRGDLTASWKSDAALSSVQWRMDLADILFGTCYEAMLPITTSTGEGGGPTFSSPPRLSQSCG